MDKIFSRIGDIKRFFGIIVMREVDFADRVGSELIVCDVMELVGTLSVFVFPSNS